MIFVSLDTQIKGLQIFFEHQKQRNNAKTHEEDE
jgi:hypothetical protein